MKFRKREHPEAREELFDAASWYDDEDVSLPNPLLHRGLIPGGYRLRSQPPQAWLLERSNLTSG